MNHPVNRRPIVVAAGSLLLLLGALGLSLSQGAGAYTLRDFVAYFCRSTGASDQVLLDTFYQLRLTRTLAAALVGASLAMSGTLLQSITRNPLAEPGLLGVSAGSVLGLTLGLSYFHAASIDSYMLWSGGGALAATALVLFIGSLSKRTSPPHLILIGIAISATLGGLANYILMANNEALEQFRFWNLGSLAGVKMTAVAGVLPYVLLATAAVAAVVRWLAVMQLGEAQAKTMGVPTAAVHTVVWLATAVLTASAISIAGPLMFAGFLSAYLARYVAGARLGLQVVYSSIFGMVLLLLSDTSARWLIQPYELPVGVIIALLGAPLTIAAVKGRTFRAALVRA